MTIKEYAKVSRIEENALRRLTRMEGFPVLRIGRKILILPNEANRWIEEHFEEISREMR